MEGEHLPSLFADSKQDQAQQQAEHERRLEQLYAQTGRLATQLSWLKKSWYRPTPGVSGAR